MTNVVGCSIPFTCCFMCTDVIGSSFIFLIFHAILIFHVKLQWAAGSAASAQPEYIQSV